MMFMGWSCCVSNLVMLSRFGVCTSRYDSAKVFIKICSIVSCFVGKVGVISS